MVLTSFGRPNAQCSYEFEDSISFYAPLESVGSSGIRCLRANASLLVVA